jgi:hypothetical protein
MCDEVDNMYGGRFRLLGQDIGISHDQIRPRRVAAPLDALQRHACTPFAPVEPIAVVSQDPGQHWAR